ncbi:MAG TPA: TolC family protein [Mariprofundaceae bacterium]|nr:TolC family protein [Mariprofundaceae bacterium]
MLFRSFPYLVFSAVLSIAPACANGAPLTLADAEALAKAHNPALAGAVAGAKAKAAVPPQAGSLPDPVFSLGALNLPVDTFSTSQEAMTQMQLGISQALPFPGKLGLKRQAAERLAEAAAENSDEVRLTLLRNVRIAWWNLAWLDKTLSIIGRNQALLRNLVQIAETRYKTGKGLQQDVLLAQLELSKLLEKEMELKAAREKQAADLNALLGQPSATPVTLPPIADTPPVVSPDISGLKDWAHDHRPLLAAMRQQVAAAGDMVALADKEYYPDFRLGAAYGFRRGNNPNGSRRADLASVQLSLTLPIFTGDKQDRLVDQRRAEQAQAEFSWQDAANQVDAEIDAAAADLRAASARVELFRQGILPQARQTTASMLAGYQVSSVDFLNLVRAQVGEFNTDIQYWQQVAMAQQAAARLAAASGTEDMNKEGTQ